jgi:hypothetical protein
MLQLAARVFRFEVLFFAVLFVVECCWEALLAGAVFADVLLWAPDVEDAVLELVRRCLLEVL